MIIIYNSGRFRMAGHGSLAGLLPFGNANGEAHIHGHLCLCHAVCSSLLTRYALCLDIVVDMVSYLLPSPDLDGGWRSLQKTTPHGGEI